jgi:hypothetical protein
MQADVRQTRMVRAGIPPEAIQALLELAAEHEAGKHDVVRMREDELMNPHNLFSRMMRLQAEGYIALAWEPEGIELGFVRLARIALTPRGHILLADLKRRQCWERWKLTWRLLCWVVATSIVTTPVTLCGRGARP